MQYKSLSLKNLKVGMDKGLESTVRETEEDSARQRSDTIECSEGLNDYIRYSNSSSSL